MRPTDEAIRRAVSRKRKAADGPGEAGRRPQPRSPTRPIRTAQPAQAPTQPPTVPPPAVDLTRDSPPGRQGAVQGRGRAETPTTPPPTQAGSGGGSAPAGRAASAGESAPAADRQVESGPERASSAPTAAGPSRSGSREGTEPGAIPSRPSLMNQGLRAERLMAQVCLPEFQRELHRQGAAAFFREVFAAQLWTTNSIAAMREVLRQSDTHLRRTQSALGEAKVRAEEAEATLRATRAEKEEAERRIHQLTSALAELEKRAEATDELRRQAAAEQENARVVGEMLDAARAAVASRDLRLESLALDLKSAELGAAAAEESARLARARAEESEAAADAARKKAAAAEELARGAGEKAVEDFRRSAAFEEEVADYNAGSYLLGFRDCREKIGRLFRGINVSDIEPDEVGQEAASDSPPPTELVVAPIEQGPLDGESAAGAGDSGSH